MRTTIFSICSILSIAGCTTIPAQLSQTPVRPSEIFDAAKCEIARTIADHPRETAFLGEKVAALQLEVNLEDASKIAPGVTWSADVAGAKVMAPASLQFDGKREGKVVVALDVKELPPLVEDLPACPPSTGLGIRSWLAEAGAIVEDARSVHADAGEMGYSVSFVVTRTVGGGLAFKIGSIDVAFNQNSFSSADTHKLILNLVSPKKEEGRSTAAAREAAVKRAQREINETRKLETITRGLAE